MSNDLFVKNIPSISEREFKHRGKMSSQDLNDIQKETFNDILDLFNKANQLQKILYEMNIANNIESSCYTRRLQEAITDINKVKEKYDNMLLSDSDFRTVTKYAYDAETIDDGYTAVIDKNTNDIIAHIVSSISKTRLYDETYDEIFVPPSLQAYIGPDSFRVGGNIYSIEDNDINNAFDGKDSTVWFRKIITSPDVEYIDNEVILGLPEDIITTKLVNEIIVKPFPVGYVDILDVQYKTNGAWQTVSGFNTHSACSEYQQLDIFGNNVTYYAIRNASNLKFNFPSVSMNQIKIKFRQRNYEYDAENNRRIWYIGLRDLDVIYNIYTKDHSEFNMTFEFPETNRNIEVYDSDVQFNNNSANSTFGISKEYFYFDSNGNTHKISSTCPFILNGHKMMVRFSIEGNQETPNISKCFVKYKLT